MKSSKNIGRKRLGRIPITSNEPSSTIRSCQIVQRSNEGKQNVSKSGGDLSFSSSFANDLDSDVDLMSALDKMETDYCNTIKGDCSTTKAGNDKISINRHQQIEKISSLEDSSKEVRSSANKNVNNFSTPARISHRKLDPVVSLANNADSNSFHDLSFTSPMEISTPQIFKAKRSSSSSTRTSTAKKTNLSVVKNSADKGKTTISKIVRTSTPEVTPRKNLRSNSAHKGKNQMKKKKVLDGLEDLQTTEDGTDVNKSNKSDFFRSLLVDNISLEESNIAKNYNIKKMKSPVTRSSVKTKTDVDRCLNNQVTAQEHNNKENDVNIPNNKQSQDNEINIEDLPQIPTRGSNQNNTSTSVSLIEKPLEIKPDLEADQLALSSWGLPDPVLKQYHTRGITHMFQWQAECLLMGNVLDGGNLVYSAPTSAGKTMVAELLVLKRVMETRKKAIIILPFVSVTREKMFYLQDLYQDAGIRVSGFMGHYSPAGGFSSIDVAVCTIEKGNSLINRMLEENKLDQLGIIVIDELHLIGDRHRGYLLELLLTKISYMSQKNNNSETNINIQIVGMSATLPNLDLLAQWLNADLYRTDYRPVPLAECVKIGTAIYDSGMNLVRDIDTKYTVKGDEDHVVPLCIETIRDGHSILIFCPTKNWCEKLSETVARALYNLLTNPDVAVADKGFVKASDLLVLPLDQSALRDVVEQLRRTAVGLDTTLGRTVQFGVAYHHAGLTFDERDIIEGAFRQGILKVLVATSTLSSGVNLPARRVLIRTPTFHGQLIDFLTYKQMIGRAGRKGVDTAGESILLCKPNERPKAEKLVTGSLPAVHSTLVREEGEPLSSSLKRAILEVVVSGVAMSPAEVSCYASCTLLAASLNKGEDHTDDLIQQCVQFLQDNEFVCMQQIKGTDGNVSERFVPTQLGAAVLSSSISPDEGLVVFSELQRARQCFVLENELHIIYQVTPIYAQIDSIDWYQYFSIWETLTPGMRKVAELVGIQESFLAKAVRGRILTKTSAQMKLLAIHKRFYTALVLHDLVQETPLGVVARKYNCNKGQLQSLQQSAATFAGMVTVFCARLGWSNLELILSQFQNRLTFGVQRELCDLVRISALNGQRARVMYNGGYQTVAALASAHPADVEALLKNSAPFQSNKKQDTESEWEAEQRRKTRCIFLTGRKGVTEYEAALAIISEAKSIIQEELGGLGIQWREGDSEPPPALKSPVLLSPLAATRKDKRRLSSKSSKNKSPLDKTDISNKPSSECIISPPNRKPSTDIRNDVKVSQTGGAGYCKDTVSNELGDGSDNCIVSSDKHKMSSQLNTQQSDIADTGQNIISNHKTSNSSKIIQEKVTNSKQSVKPNIDNTVDKDRGKPISAEEKTTVTTTAVIEKVPDYKNDLSKPVQQESTKIQFSKGNSKHLVNTDLEESSSDVVNKAANCVSSNVCGPEKFDLKDIDKQTLANMESTVKIPAKNQPIESKDQSTNNSNETNFTKKQNKYVKEVQKEHEHDKPMIQASSDFQEIAETSKKEIESCVLNIQKGEDTFTHSKSGEKTAQVVNEVIDENDFGESFMIDTQSLNSLENSENKKSTNIKEVAKEIVQKEADKLKQVNVNLSHEKALSEALFSDVEIDSFDLSNGIIVPCKQSPANGHERKSDHNLNESQNLRKTITENDHNESRYNVTDSGSEVDVSNNALDMNISQCSGEDMFNQTGDLVAASNYERVILSDDSRLGDMNDSYQDLHIPYQSGQEICFEKMDKSVQHATNTTTNQHVLSHGAEMLKKCFHAANFPAIGEQKNVLGQFSSPEPAEVKCHEILHEDLAIALEMGESFSSTFSATTQNKANHKGTGTVKEKDCDLEDNFGDSLTISMVEKVLEEPTEIPQPSIPAKQDLATVKFQKCNSVDKCQKQICDKNSKTESLMKSKQIVINKSLSVDDKHIEMSERLEKEQFVTPKRTAVKRFRCSPVIKDTKIQKVQDIGHSTPEALEKHLRRTNKVYINDKNNLDNDKVDQRATRKRKSRDNMTPAVCGKSRRGSVSEMNTSTGSDCVPPTPPDETPASSLYNMLMTPARSPVVNLTPVSPFSPKLKQKNKSQQSYVKVKTAVKDLNDVNTHQHALTSNCAMIGNNKQISDKNRLTRTNSKDVEIDECSDKNKAMSNNLMNGETKTGGEKNKPNETKTVNTHVEKEGNAKGSEDNGNDDNGDEDFLSPSFIDPDQSGITLTQSSFSIIDVCGDKRLFKTFIMEWRTKSRYAISLACERLMSDCPGGGIGGYFKQGETGAGSDLKDIGISVESLGVNLVGLAVSWENRDAYYISFTHDQPKGDPDDTLAPPPSDTDISIAIRIKAVKSVLQQAVCQQQQEVTMVMFDVKSHFRAMAEGCGFTPKGKCEDPKVACWMLDPGVKEKNLHRMVTNLLPTEVHMLHGIGGGIGVSSLGMSPQNPGSGRYRATTEAVLVRHLGEYFRACLQNEEIYNVFTDVEMPSAVTLCRMELNGFGFSQNESENQKTVMTAKLSALEEQAYMLANHPFSLSATDDVAQVLFIELQLPPNGDPITTPGRKLLAPKRGGAPRRGRGKPQYSTSKDILEKLKKLHPLPGIILEWRRITNALTKTVFPLQKEKVLCDWLSMYRIYGDCQLHTATGRVSMTEPNLQNVPKDFEILLPDLIGESPPPNSALPVGKRTRAGNSKLRQMIGPRQVAMMTEENTGSQFCVSMRHAFVPFKGGVLLAADYSQLELRMISNLSKDPKLISILNKDGDVFKLITAQWKNIKPEQVTQEQRAQAKQVCYGMIYGIGAKALGEQLDVEENDAAVFIETFKAKYPGMRTYLRQIVEDCRTKGYVKTMLGRKRYLQAITSTNPHARAQAERQAVNTTVQGSAADLVKMAMIKIDERLAEMFPNTQYTHKHKLSGKHPSRIKTPPDGGYLVLQLHDELIYEVTESQVRTVAQLVKHCMETTVKLPVKMPVKIKVGPSWGKLEDFDI